MDRLASEYRYVIVDSAPLEYVADGNQIATLCDGAVMVVRCGHVSRKIIRQSMMQLEAVNCKLLGVVLNREQEQGRGYGRYYGGMVTARLTASL